MLLKTSLSVHHGLVLLLTAGGGLLAQSPLSPGTNPEAIKQMLQSSGVDLQSLKRQAGSGSSTQKALRRAAKGQGNGIDAQSPEVMSEEERQDRELEALKAREKGPRRFCQDMFRFRDHAPATTEGGIAEDYVLGPGDDLSLLMTGGKDGQVDTTVDGKGEVDIPETGVVRVSGMSLSQARLKIQAAVRRNFKTARVDLKVTKLREVRVYVLGEVYRQGSYLVPSLSSVINVLSLAGGPNGIGSYRRIQVLRGGRSIGSLDLYGLRSEGKGSFNYSFQNGDTIFVPLAETQVLLEGAFRRVVAEPLDPLPDEDLDADPTKRKKERLIKQIRALEGRLGLAASEVTDSQATDSLGDGPEDADGVPTKNLTLEQRTLLQDRLDDLEKQLADLRANERGDQRLSKEESRDLALGRRTSDPSVPAWIKRWQAEGTGPVMQFEVLKGETPEDLIRHAGGQLPGAQAGQLILRHQDLQGVTTVTEVSLVPGKVAGVQLENGDQLSALPLRDQFDRAITLRGWVRAVGRFGRGEGLRIGDLLKRDNQILPDTYLGRGEVIRHYRETGRTEYLGFDPSKALAGDPAANLELRDGDEIELYRVTDFRLGHTVTVDGPMSRAGEFPFHPGMRVSDLLFRAGVPFQSANLDKGELARFKDGKVNEVVSLDLTQLLTTEGHPAQAPANDQINPLLRPSDRISVFERPNFKLHRTVQISGEVGRPGAYDLDASTRTLKDLVARAGGLVPSSMPKAGILLRQPETLGASVKAAEQKIGIGTKDPTTLGLNEIMDRLMETTRHPLSGHLQKTPVLHPWGQGQANRLVVDFEAALKGDPDANVELEDGDQIVIPKQTDAVYIVGETASPFGVYKTRKGASVSDVIELAGGTTRNADTGNVRLLKANGQILSGWVKSKKVEPGDVVIVPQKVPRDYNWQESLQAITPLAILYNAIKK